MFLRVIYIKRHFMMFLLHKETLYAVSFVRVKAIWAVQNDEVSYAPTAGNEFTGRCESGF